MQRPNDSLTQRALFVKNLNFNITGADLYDLFGKYGPIRQIRLGTDANLKTKGTAYVVFESPDDAKEAVNQLNGFHLMERYIVVLYHHPSKQQASALAKAELRAREEALAEEKKRLGMKDE
ncbi:pre-mRNA branch site protein p14 [Cryptococcus deuterogattii R265]|uniref:Pre-mRNA branch site protein p14 n=1 Tax=Cryptococcus deuterogattii (strain R265) TaxID=294750 RepID=A0A095CF46_CRYD2|nr:pre-mRNA branch site protein p14 [Cryptococcus deuterogattii R265]KIR26780.1 pre-mRNA branch site protein p14 [Cryptococcus deuterogattii LA55]KIR36653.1 pre-mRNA branch site protein p14 [Cryptococcus deuterogattii MMRL2647]KIR76082.1 pre-mRNA branch site protein p14 [Cryptococcus deuterogattii CA1014]KIR96026.1 pre-mRNA branch site protein p14 [Cryptococcus deuterogattii CBS 10090]KIS02522.1 pre-mRNA branch site protein p14 [Cryptococcus deuterogattii 2001/935-1]